MIEVYWSCCTSLLYGLCAQYAFYDYIRLIIVLRNVTACICFAPAEPVSFSYFFRYNLPKFDFSLERNESLNVGLTILFIIFGNLGLGFKATYVDEPGSIVLDYDKERMAG